MTRTRGPKSRRWAAAIAPALVTAGIVLGCGAEVPDLGCTPGVTCKRAIDVVEDGADCTAARNRANSSGICGEASLACDSSHVDLDADPANGCEAALSDVSSDWVAVPEAASLGLISVNTTTADLGMSVALVALDSDDPSCPPVTFEHSCFYSVRALMISFPDFEIEGVAWRNGAGTITGPVAAEDDADGPTFTATMVVSFRLEEAEDVREVLSSGPAAVRLTRNPTDSPTGTVYLQAEFDFGYQIEILVDQALTFR